MFNLNLRPYGRFNVELAKIVKEAGYICAVGAIDEPNKSDTSIFCLNRYEIRNVPFSSFVAKRKGLTGMPLLCKIHNLFFQSV